MRRWYLESGRNRYLLGQHGWPVILGRGAATGLEIDHHSVSRRHALIEPAPDGRLKVTDLGSSNGTYVDGERVQNRVLQPGARLKLGHVTFVVLAEGHRDEIVSPDGAPAGGRGGVWVALTFVVVLVSVGVMAVAGALLYRTGALQDLRTSGAPEPLASTAPTTTAEDSTFQPNDAARIDSCFAGGDVLIGEFGLGAADGSAITAQCGHAGGANWRWTLLAVPGHRASSFVAEQALAGGSLGQPISHEDGGLSIRSQRPEREGLVEVRRHREFVIAFAIWGPLPADSERVVSRVIEQSRRLADERFPP